eukprot:TRINITY_DN8_c1_g1_i3.p1 TRINITY_DN8_c1_g1~~TRINITY_DN8_c1_g1_i3.p1  ORF type:complete len:406 (+),score=302.00 TRINITY_DN8_c1_g1_i3:77-1294(+)
MARLAGANDFEKLKSLCLKTHKEQLVWFLNGFWNEYGQRDAENFWKYALKLKELDLQKGLDGNELDELNMHRFLEFFKETMTVSEMRDNLRSTGAIQGNVRMIPISHILIFKYRVDWHRLANAPQGDNRAEIEEAQRKLDQVQAAFKQAEAASAEAKRALREAEAREADSKAREANARAKEADAKAREAEARAAQDELQAALNELHAQEAAYKAKVDDLTRRGNDESVGVVTRNKAKAELAQVLAEDPLPLRKAKITQEAAVKKAEKATNIAAEARSKASASANAASQARKQASEQAAQAKKAAEQAAQAAEAAKRAAEAASQARKVAEQAAQAASQARHQATVAAQAAEAAQEEMGRKLEEAEAYFEEVKSKPGNARGAMWWMERELHEARAYLPERKGGYRKK